MSALDASRYLFSPLALPALLTGLAALLLAAAVLGREGRSGASLAFLRLCLPVSLWMLSDAGMYAAAGAEVALWWAGLAQLAIAFIPPACYGFTVAVLGIRERRRAAVRAGWLLFAGFSVLFLTTDVFLAGLRRYPWGFYPRLGGRSVLFLAPFTVLLGAALWELWRARGRLADGTAGLRTRAFLLAFGIGALAAVDLLPAYGIQVHPLGSIPLLASLAISAWAIGRYGLADLGPSFVAAELLRTTPDMVVACDREGRIRLCNPAVRRTLGYSSEELAGESVETLVDTEPGREVLAEALAGRRRFQGETALRAMGGGAVEVSLSLSELRDGHGHPVGALLLARDIRRRKRMEEELLRRALYDSATGLPNRTLFLERIGRALAHARRRGVPFAVLCLELEKRDGATDSPCSPVPEAALARAARRLNGCVREVDTVARLEGGRFGILLRHVTEAQHAVRTAERMRRALGGGEAGAAAEAESPVPGVGPESALPGVGPEPAVGIVLSSPEYGAPEELLRDALAALAAARRAATGRIRLFGREAGDGPRTRGGARRAGGAPEAGGGRPALTGSRSASPGTPPPGGRRTGRARRSPSSGAPRPPRCGRSP